MYMYTLRDVNTKHFHWMPFGATSTGSCVCVCCFCLYKSRTLGPLIDDLNLLATAINEQARRLIIPLAFFFIIYGNSHRAKWLITVTRIKIGKGDNRSTIKFNYNTTLHKSHNQLYFFFVSCRIHRFAVPI